MCTHVCANPQSDEQMGKLFSQSAQCPSFLNYLFCPKEALKFDESFLSRLAMISKTTDVLFRNFLDQHLCASLVFFCCVVCASGIIISSWGMREVQGEQQSTATCHRILVIFMNS